MFVNRSVAMGTSRNKSISSTGKCKISTRKTMEQKSPELKIKSFTNRRRHLLKPFEIPGQKIGNPFDQERNFCPEYNSTNKPFTRRMNFPSYRGALKWVRDNKDTIDTFVQLLQIHPELLKNKLLDKFLGFLRTHRIQTHASDDLKETMESIPTITVTSDAYTRLTNKTRMLIVGKQVFEEDNGSCSELISGLSNYFSVYCHNLDDNSEIHNLIVNIDTCLVLISESSFSDHTVLSVLQQVRFADIPLVFLKTHNLTIPEHVKQGRSLSSCSSQSTERITPISLPVSQISRTPNYLSIDSHFVSEFDTSFLINGCKNAIKYCHQDTLECIKQICSHFNVKPKDQYFPDAHTKLDIEMDSLSIRETPVSGNEITEISFDSGSSRPASVLDQNTLGASLIVMEHMTHCNRDEHDINSKSFEHDHRSVTASRNILELPSITTCKTPPLSPVFRKREKSNKNHRNVASFRYEGKPANNTITERVSTGTPESSTEDTTYLLFHTKKGELTTEVVNWPHDAKNIPNEDCMSEDSSSVGFQDIDFGSSLWSTNSDED